MLLNRYEQIWFITGGLPPHDPNNGVERWLAAHSYQAAAEWYDDYRLLQYGTVQPMESHTVDIILQDQATSRVTIQTTNMPETIDAGMILPVEIHYQVDQAAHDLRWFVQLWNEQGVPVAFLDSAPLDGYASFNTLQSGVEKAGLLVPKDAARGIYRVIAGLYNPAAEGQRLQSSTGDDFVELGQVRIP